MSKVYHHIHLGYKTNVKGVFQQISTALDKVGGLKGDQRFKKRSSRGRYILTFSSWYGSNIKNTGSYITHNAPETYLYGIFH